MLDAIRFRYSTESIAEEQAAEQQPGTADAEQPREDRRPLRARQPRREATPGSAESRQPTGDQPPREERQLRENRRPRRERPRRENQEQPDADQQGSVPRPEDAKERPEQESPESSRSALAAITGLPADPTIKMVSRRKSARARMLLPRRLAREGRPDGTIITIASADPRLPVNRQAAAILPTSKALLSGWAGACVPKSPQK